MTIRELPAKVPRVPHGIRNANFKQERHAPKQTKSACRSKCYNLRVRSYSLMLARSRYFLSAGTVGEWLSLVEHLVRDQGVGGSNPLSPTNLFKHLQQSHLGATGNLLSISGAESSASRIGLLPFPQD